MLAKIILQINWQAHVVQSTRTKLYWQLVICNAWKAGCRSGPNHAELALLYTNHKFYDCLHSQTNWADLCWPTKMCQCKRIVLIKNSMRLAYIYLKGAELMQLTCCYTRK